MAQGWPEKILKAGTLFDWIDPIYDVGLMVMGRQPIHIPHEYRHKAAKVLNMRPHTYDFLRDCWVFMVDDYDEAIYALESVGVPYL